MRWNYAKALYKADGATLGDLREAVTTLEDAEPTARRVLGGAHPDTTRIENALRSARAELQDAQNSEAFRNWKAMHARDTPPKDA